MIKGIFKRLTAITAAVCIIFASVGCSSKRGGNTKIFNENVTGTLDGYEYELWKDKGDTTFNVEPGGGTFSCEWNNINNALFRRGKKYDCSRSYRAIGNISIDYGVDYQPDGNSYMCVYGWTRDPLIEYYIVESWGTWRPPGAPIALGTVTVDGGTYDIYKTTRYEQPSIDGTQTFDQYWSVRQEKPAANGTKFEGTISVSKHFDAWKKCGLELGNMYEVALTIEGYQSKGKATIYKNVLNVDGEYSEATDIEVTVDEEAVANMANSQTGTPDEAGFFENGFEKGTQGWFPRGSSMVAINSEFASKGEHSLFVSGRADNWNGATVMLSSDVYKPGEAYHFKADVLQNSGKDVTMKMTMQYDMDGEKYDQIDLATAKSGEWLTLENKAYVIPDGAENLQLYLESPDSLTDFYIEEVSGGEKS